MPIMPSFSSGMASMRQSMKYNEYRDLVHDFTRSVFPASATKLMRQIDDNMQGKPEADMANIAQAVFPEQLPFVLGCTCKRVSILSLMKGEVTDSPVMLDFFKLMCATKGRGQSGVVMLWRPDNLSTWTISDMAVLPMPNKARIVIPAMTAGYHDIVISSLATWAGDYKQSGGNAT